MAEKIPADTLVVVADGAHAKLYRSGHDGDHALSLTLLQELTPTTLAGQGPSGSRPQGQAPKETNEATFVKGVAQMIEGMHGKNAFKHLVLIADPQSLGQLRDALPKTVEKLVLRSLSKDYTSQSPKEIAAALEK